MDRDRIREKFEEEANDVCCSFNADATCLPESVIDWMVDKFIGDYAEEEDNDMIPDKYMVIRYMCCYIQENI